MTHSLVGLDDLHFRLNHGIPLYYNGLAVSEVEARRLLAGYIPGIDRPATVVPPPPVDIAPRIAACSSCEYRRADTDRCSLMSCGCSLTSRQASPYATCPADRWPLQPSAEG